MRRWRLARQATGCFGASANCVFYLAPQAGCSSGEPEQQVARKSSYATQGYAHRRIRRRRRQAGNGNFGYKEFFAASLPHSASIDVARTGWTDCE